MDAARSAWRSGASPVTIVYRRGRAEMPAQEEEIEAAEREGIVVRTGLAPVEVVGRDGSVVGIRCMETRPSAGDAAGLRRAAWEPVPGTEHELPATTILVAVGEEPDPSILPEGAGIEVSGWAGIVADPRTLATGRAGIFAGGDVVSGPKTIIDAVASGRRAAASIHEYLAGVTDGEARHLRHGPLPDRAEGELTLDLATRPRAHAPLPMVQPGSFEATQVGFDETTARSEADRCFRCDAVYAGPVVDVRAGRGPDVVARPITSPPAPTTSLEARHDTRPGIRLLRCRRGIHRRDDRRRARRPVAARGRAPPRPRLHGPDDGQVHASARRRPVVDHLHRRCATSSSSRSSSAASSSSTRTSSPGSRCRSPAVSPRSAPSRSC